MKTNMTALLAALAATTAATGATAQNRPAAQQAQPAPQAQQQVQVNSVPLLCRLREQELVTLNRLVVERNQALQRETDATKRQALAQQVQSFTNKMRETEASWSRMDCARIIYGAR